ncbi:hypothetical protein BC833DRAFT_645000 [Globomyces pollinis-pini]|nr:hypothetical protein BC833DRAFT_645000 [Globomyces pollinis-pini]
MSNQRKTAGGNSQLVFGDEHHPTPPSTPKPSIRVYSDRSPSNSSIRLDHKEHQSSKSPLPQIHGELPNQHKLPPIHQSQVKFGDDYQELSSANTISPKRTTGRRVVNPPGGLETFSTRKASATLKPASATVKPASATIKPASATVKPASATIKPASATVKPASATLKQGTLRLPQQVL